MAAIRFLRWYCKPALAEEIEGDLYEEFQRRYHSKGKFFASLHYWWDVLSFFRPFAIRGFTTPYINMNLLQSYITVALRSMNKQRLFTGINVFGLAISMLVGLIIITVIVDQSLSDKFHTNLDRLYRVTTTSKYLYFDQYNLATSPVPLASELNPDNIDQAIVIRRFLQADATYNERTYELSGHYANANFLKAFTFPLVAGNPDEALEKPFSLVLTKKGAQKIFGEKQALGEVVSLKDIGEFTVTGIMEDIPRNSHMQFEVLASQATVAILEKEEKLWPSIDNWKDYSSSYVYLLLHEHANPKNVQQELDQLAQEKYDSDPNLDVRFKLQKVSAINPGKDLSNQIGPTVEIEFIYVCTVLAFIVLVSACFNYTNLSIARLLRRSREIGIRKVQGGTRVGIFFQFMLESIIVSLFSLLAAVLIFHWLKPYLVPYLPNQFVSLDFTWVTYVSFFLFALFTGAVAGFIPSLVLSRIQSVQVLKGSAIQIFGKMNFKRGLLVAQFALSMIFIVITITAYRQYVFSLNFDMGFRKESIVNVQLQGNEPNVFSQKYSQLAEVDKISFSSYTLATGTISNIWLKLDNPDDSIVVNRLLVDEHFTDLHELKFVAGSGFNLGLNEEQALINEFVVNRFGFTNARDVVGKKMMTSQGNEILIMGVLKDFHYDKIHREKQGFYLSYAPDRVNVANVLISSQSDWAALYPKMKSVWKEMDQGVHEFKADLYVNELRESYSDLVFIMKLIGSIAFMVIVIASLGLLGMVVYTVDVRIREIGIRKVLGAAEVQLVSLLSKGFLKLIVLAGIIASAISYAVVFYLILPRMAYKPNIGVLEFLLAFLILILPGLIFILPSVLRAARKNPAETLKYE